MGAAHLSNFKSTRTARAWDMFTRRQKSHNRKLTRLKHTIPRHVVPSPLSSPTVITSEGKPVPIKQSPLILPSASGRSRIDVDSNVIRASSRTVTPPTRRGQRRPPGGQGRGPATPARCGGGSRVGRLPPAPARTCRICPSSESKAGASAGPVSKGPRPRRRLPPLEGRQGTGMGQEGWSAGQSLQIVRQTHPACPPGTGCGAAVAITDHRCQRGSHTPAPPSCSSRSCDLR